MRLLSGTEKISVLLFLVLPMLLLGCSKREENPSLRIPMGAQAPPKGIPVVTPEHLEEKRLEEPKILFKDRVEPVLVEEQANALSHWRMFRMEKPVLMVFSSKLISPIPESLIPVVDQLLSTGNTKEMCRRVANPVADLLLASDMGVSAAIRHEYFSKIIWVVPLKDGTELLPIENFKDKYRETAGGWGSDIDSFHETSNGTFSGRFGGLPVEIMTVDKLPDIKKPVVIHFDTAYFSNSYRNEVKTPLYAMTKKILEQIKKRQYGVLKVSVSCDNLSYEVPLRMRFLGKDICQFISNPELLHEFSSKIKIRTEINYLENFFQPDMIHAKAHELVKTDEKDADGHYALYRVLRQKHNNESGMISLRSAILLDPTYAEEYIELINQAMRNKSFGPALAMVNEAIAVLPTNPLIKLRKAQILIESGDIQNAKTILEELKKLQWTKEYYPKIVDDINYLLSS